MLPAPPLCQSSGEHGENKPRIVSASRHGARLSWQPLLQPDFRVQVSRNLRSGHGAKDLVVHQVLVHLLPIQEAFIHERAIEQALANVFHVRAHQRLKEGLSTALHLASTDLLGQNLQRLRENAQALGDERQRGAPREGSALLQGLAVCAICGERMTIRYHIRGDRRVPDYMCQRRGIETGQPICQLVNGGPVDEAIGKLLVDAVTPVTLEVALAVQKELESRCDESDRLRRQEVERARYEADLARRRFMHVDPGNRLVADSLEAEWNQTLRAVSEAQERYEKQKQTDGTALSDKQRASIMALVKDFPRLWQDPRTPDRERKRMVRLLIADVTLLKGADIRAQVRFNGGATRTLHVSPPKSAWQLRKSAPAVVAEVDGLLEDHTEAEAAELLNRKGLTSGMGKRFHRLIVRRIRSVYGLKNRYKRLRARGLLTIREMAKLLHVCQTTIKIWRRAGLLAAHRYDDKDQYRVTSPLTVRTSMAKKSVAARHSQ